MNRRGFSLIELVVIMLVIMALLVIAIPQFGSMTRKYGIERQTRQLYADMMTARIRAMNTNRTHILTATATAYSVADDRNSNGIVDAGETVIQAELAYPVTWGTGVPINFDGRGVPSVGGITINAGTINATAQTAAAFDCIYVQATKSYIGKMDGVTCVQK